MSILKNKKQADYTIIVGCGRLGANLANTLSEEGENVLILDKEKDAFRKLSLSFGGLTVEGDGTDFHSSCTGFGNVETTIRFYARLGVEDIRRALLRAGAGNISGDTSSTPYSVSDEETLKRLVGLR